MRLKQVATTSRPIFCFHQTLLRASHNRMLVLMSKALSALLRTSFEISTSRPNGAANSLHLHRAILDAVIASEPARAEKACLELIDSAAEDIAEVLGSRRKLPSVGLPAKPLPGPAPAIEAGKIRA